MSNTKPLSQNAIGRELGLSSANMTKLRKQGCPMDSVESVRAWRLERQNVAQRKPEPRRSKGTKDSHVAHAEACMQAAVAILESGASLDAFFPTLRAALASVPANARSRVHLDFDVMKVLLAPVLALVPPRESNPVNDDGTPAYVEQMSDDDAQAVGAFWYEVAAGEWDFSTALAGKSVGSCWALNLHESSHE
ncbi:hypothetical protein [Acidovorax sp. KKS102]|uniref:hypothetical protein n=1 Tax=Acidovorax sp. KKS102 TaxID=358220 RepID=UPI0011D258D2|nr:hypothetical protein [Acidovorax sp. KKS102]